MSRYVVACDAGGTMTDVIIVDEEGRSVIGKAPTSPQDESIGYMESFWEALEFMGIDREQGAQFGGQVETAIYTGTSMLNTVINMSGYRTGLLVTRGFEDIIAIGAFTIGLDVVDGLLLCLDQGQYGMPRCAE